MQTHPLDTIEENKIIKEKSFFAEYQIYRHNVSFLENFEENKMNTILMFIQRLVCNQLKKEKDNNVIWYLWWKHIIIVGRRCKL